MYIVFGGSFNPPTIAHRNVIVKLLQTFENSKVLLLPVGDDYHKPELVQFKHRKAMLELLTNDMDNVIISTIESERPYQGTLASLNELSQTYSPLYFVIGSDNLHQFEQWINYKTLLKTYPFIVMKRKNGLNPIEAENLFKDIPHHFFFVDFDENISSSLVRKNILDANQYLTEPVYQYVLENNLYQEKAHV